MATDNEMRAAGIHLPGGSDYIRDGDDAISANARVLWDRIESARWNRNGSALQVASVLDDLPSGTYSIWSAAVSTAQGMPEIAQWSIDVKRWGVAGGIMLAQTRTDPPRSYMSARLSSGWTAWVRSDAGGASTKYRLPVASPASLKSTPLALTTGYGSARRSGSGTTSVIQHLHPQVGRVQLHMRNWTPRYTSDDRAAVTLTGVQIGRHTGDGNGTDWVSLPSGATAYESGWIDVPEAMRGGEVVVRYTWSGSDVQQCLGTGWTDGSSDQRPPLFVWLELEVPAHVPVVANYGSSTAAGVGSARPLIDSWLSRWARANDAVPAFWADSGSSALTWIEEADRRWERYGYTVHAPDAMLYAMGSNDWAGGFDLAELQRRITATVEEIRDRITPNVYGTTITPRATPPANDSTRLALNDWMPSSGLFRDVFDAAAAVSLPGGAFDPAADADGIHPNDVGHQRIANSIDRPVIDPPAPGPRTTGWRDITAWVQNRVSGRILIRRDENVMVFVLDELVLSVSGSVSVNRFPTGLRPQYRVRGDWHPSTTAAAEGGSVNISGGGYCNIYGVVADQAMSARIVGDFPDGYDFPSPYPGDPA